MSILIESISNCFKVLLSYRYIYKVHVIIVGVIKLYLVRVLVVVAQLSNVAPGSFFYWCI